MTRSLLRAHISFVLAMVSAAPLLAGLSAALPSMLPAEAVVGQAVLGQATILLRDLTRVRGLLVSIEERQVTYRDARGAIVVLPAGEVVGVVRDAAPSDPRGPHVVFADGQRLPGRPVLGDGTLRWRHHLLDAIALDAERLAQIVLVPSAADANGLGTTASRDDVVELTNGDRIEGIVTALGSSILVERLDGTVQSVPFERVALVTFVHAPSAAPGDWPATVWLVDGTILHTERPILADDGIVRLRPQLRPSADGTPDRPALLPIDGVAGIQFAPGVLLPLAMLVPASIEVPPHRLGRPGPLIVDPNAPMGISALRLRGPVTVRYRLPTAGMRLVADASIPADALGWGDFELVIEDGAHERLRQRMNASAPRIAIDVIVTTDRLVIRLEEGERGPIQDELILGAAILGATRP